MAIPIVLNVGMYSMALPHGNIEMMLVVGRERKKYEVRVPVWYTGIPVYRYSNSFRCQPSRVLCGICGICVIYAIYAT